VPMAARPRWLVYKPGNAKTNEHDAPKQSDRHPARCC
jgi:hypothetical protein